MSSEWFPEPASYTWFWAKNHRNSWFWLSKIIEIYNFDQKIISRMCQSDALGFGVRVSRVAPECQRQSGTVVWFNDEQFKTIFDHFDRNDTILVTFSSRSLSCCGILSIRKIMIFDENQRFRVVFLDSGPGFCKNRSVFEPFLIALCNVFMFF